MSARFVITRSALASKEPGRGITYAVEYGSPRNVSREDRLRRIVIELTEEAEALPLSELVRLFEAAVFRDNPRYHKPPPPRLKAPDAKAFAAYRERNVVWDAKNRPPDETERLQERQRIIAAAHARRDAVRAIGEFCRAFGERPRWRSLPDADRVRDLSKESTQ